MKLKSLLLGSAAALLTVGAAQAADFGAEPVNYVRVCDAFGPGFYYAPGTDTCIKISGWVRFDVNIGTHSYNTGVSASHAFGSYNQLQVTAASMTEYGPLIGFIALDMGIGGWNVGVPPVFVPGIGSGVGVDAATLQLGPFSAGWAWSSFSNNIFATYHNAQFMPLGGNHTLFAQLSWAWEGVGLFIAAEDYRTRDGGTSTGQIPDIVGGVTFSTAGINAKVSAGWGDRVVTDTWGVHGEVGFALGQLGNLSVQANYSANANDWAQIGGGGVAGNWAGYWVGLSTPWSSQFSTLLAGVWYDGPAAAADYGQVIGQLNFRPVNNFLVGVEVQHTMPSVGASSTTAIGRVQRSFP